MQPRYPIASPLPCSLPDETGPLLGCSASRHIRSCPGPADLPPAQPARQGGKCSDGNRREECPLQEPSPTEPNKITNDERSEVSYKASEDSSHLSLTSGTGTPKR